MSKRKVVIIGVADWAGSAYNACQAINTTDDFECRAINFYKHPLDFDTDILIPLFPLGKIMSDEYTLKSVGSPEFDSACQVMEAADIIHFWNTHPTQVEISSSGLPVNFKKIKAVTWTGSTYRKNHKKINESSRRFDQWKITVQNPCLKFPEEIESTFIPHAINVDDFKPSGNKGGTIATYRPVLNDEPSRSPDIDIRRAYEIVKAFPGWKVDLDYTMPHSERMEKLRECSIFLQDLDSKVGYWGRSVLEASLLGIPSLQTYDPEMILNLAEGRLGEDIPIVQSNREDMEKHLTELIEDPVRRNKIGESAREWVRTHYSYEVVGNLYSEFYKTL